MNAADLGRKGEAIAAKYYQQRGYLLLNHHYRTRMGELDLILYKDDTIVFSEVKTRQHQGAIRAMDAVNPHKQKRLVQAAGQYLQHSPYTDSTVRFDVVEVWPAETGWQVHCIQNAFTL